MCYINQDPGTRTDNDAWRMEMAMNDVFRVYDNLIRKEKNAGYGLL